MTTFIVLYLGPLLLVLFYGIYFLTGDRAIFLDLDFDEIHDRALAMLLVNINLFSFYYCLYHKTHPTHIQIRKDCFKFLGLQVLYFSGLYFAYIHFDFIQSPIRIYSVLSIVLLIYTLVAFLNLGIFKEQDHMPLKARVVLNKELDSAFKMLFPSTYMLVIMGFDLSIEYILSFFWLMTLLILLIRPLKPFIDAQDQAYEIYLAQIEHQQKEREEDLQSAKIEENSKSKPSSVDENIARYKAQQRKKAQQKAQSKWPFG